MKKYLFLQKLALQSQKEASHQTGSTARQRATLQVLSALLQWQTNCCFHEADQVLDKHKAGEQEAIACITDDRIEIDVNSLLRLSKRILENGYYKQNEIDFKVKGSLYKYNSQGRIPG